MYQPTGGFSTKYMMRLMLSESSTVQSLLGAANATEALDKIQTYAPIYIPDDDASPVVVPPFQYPRILVHCDSVRFQTAAGGDIYDVDPGSREVLVAGGFYIPSDNASIENESDEEAWIDDQFWSIMQDCMDLSGTGEPVTGRSHLVLMNPSYMGADMFAYDERDFEQDSDQDANRWLGMLRFEVR